MFRTFVGAVALAIALTVFSPGASLATDVSIPSIGVKAPLVSGNLGGNIHKVYGDIPVVGSAVLTGHSFVRGGRKMGGIFDNLPNVNKGDLVMVGKRRYTVTKVMSVSIPRYRKMQKVLHSVRGHARVVLVTCTNRNVQGVYTRRVLVFTRPEK